MAFRCTMLVGALLIASGCDRASSDLATIKTARSLAAERALIARLDNAGKLRRAYSEGMQRAGTKQLLSAHNLLSEPDGEAGQAIGAAAVLPDKAGALHAAAGYIAAIEARRENH
jgi:hypothetical protein